MDAWLLKKIQLVRSFVRYRYRATERENDTHRQIEGQRAKGYRGWELMLGPMSPLRT